MRVQTPKPWKAVEALINNAPSQWIVIDGTWRRTPIANCGDSEYNAQLVAIAPQMLVMLSPGNDVDLAHDELSDLLEDPAAENDDIRTAAVTLCETLAQAYDDRQQLIKRMERD